MSRAILFEYDTEQEAKACLEGILFILDTSLRNKDKDRYNIYNDRKYNGKWTINID